MNVRFLAFAALAMVVLGGAYAAWCAFGPVRYVALNAPIRHDDFLFTVQSISQQPASSGTAYSVQVLVTNQAQRVRYRWSDSIAYILDSNGNKYAPVSNGAFVLDPGESRVATVRFLLPEGTKNATLRFWDGIYMGDAFDGNAYGRTAIKL